MDPEGEHSGMAVLLEPSVELPEQVNEVFVKARSCWLKNPEVADLLENYSAYGIPVSTEPPVQPAGGSVYMFDKTRCRFFRKDGHNWKKKPDGKTIRETHEKLKVGNAKKLHCYYAHADQDDGLQRRCYWLLDKAQEHIVLVHYLYCAPAALGSRPLGSADIQLAAAGVAAAGAPPARKQQRRAAAAKGRAALEGRGDEDEDFEMAMAGSGSTGDGGGYGSGSGELGYDVPLDAVPVLPPSLPEQSWQWLFQQQQQQQRGGEGPWGPGGSPEEDGGLTGQRLAQQRSGISSVPLELPSLSNPYSMGGGSILEWLADLEQSLGAQQGGAGAPAPSARHATFSALARQGSGLSRDLRALLEGTGINLSQFDPGASAWLAQLDTDGGGAGAESWLSGAGLSSLPEAPLPSWHPDLDIASLNLGGLAGTGAAGLNQAGRQGGPTLGRNLPSLRALFRLVSTAGTSPGLLRQGGSGGGSGGSGGSSGRAANSAGSGPPLLPRQQRRLQQEEQRRQQQEEEELERQQRQAASEEQEEGVGEAAGAVEMEIEAWEEEVAGLFPAPPAPSAAAAPAGPAWAWDGGEGGLEGSGEAEVGAAVGAAAAARQAQQSFRRQRTLEKQESWAVLRPPQQRQRQR